MTTERNLLAPEDHVTPCFSFSEDFRAQFLASKARFGYNGFGHFIFFRTYSRLKPNGQNETFPECILRVVEGLMSIRKHYLLQRGPLPERFEEDARDMCYFFLKMRTLPPGRALWACGTPVMYNVGSACLNNCAFVSTQQHLGHAIGLMMDLLMLGCGAGFDTKFAGHVHVPVSESMPYVVPDTREGW